MTTTLPAWVVDVEEDILQAEPVEAGDWTVLLSQDLGAAPVVQLDNPKVVSDVTAGFLSLADARHLAVAILRQWLRAKTGRVWRKRATRREHATPRGYSPATTRAGR